MCIFIVKEKWLDLLPFEFSLVPNYTNIRKQPGCTWGVHTHYIRAKLERNLKGFLLQTDGRENDGGLGAQQDFPLSSQANIWSSLLGPCSDAVLAHLHTHANARKRTNGVME